MTIFLLLCVLAVQAVILRRLFARGAAPASRAATVQALIGDARARVAAREPIACTLVSRSGDVRQVGLIPFRDGELQAVVGSGYVRQGEDSQGRPLYIQSPEPA